MSDEWDFPEADDMTGGGTYLDQPGTFHLLINEVHDGCGPNGNPIEGFSIECEVMAGTVEDCAGKKVGITIWKPNLTRSENSIKMAKRIGAAFFIATDVINPNQLGKSGAIDCNLSNGRQFVAKLVRQTDKEGKETKFLQPNYSDIFHVDDPEVDTIPKDQEALKIIAKELRHDAAYFAYKAKKNGTPKPKQSPPPTSSDFSDL
jgi:hypothetical protein